MTVQGFTNNIEKKNEGRRGTISSEEVGELFQARKECSRVGPIHTPQTGKITKKCIVCLPCLHKGVGERLMM